MVGLLLVHLPQVWDGFLGSNTIVPWRHRKRCELSDDRGWVREGIFLVFPGESFFGFWEGFSFFFHENLNMGLEGKAHCAGVR